MLTSKTWAILTLLFGVGLTQASFLTSCSNRCDTKGHDEDWPCQCNSRCLNYDDCCPDYPNTCLTCRGRCEDAFTPSLPCQCNPHCLKHDDCCSDFTDFCPISTSATVTDIDLATLSEDLLANDVNNCGNLVTLNAQGSTCFSCRNDAAPEPLLTVAPEAYTKPTIAKLLPLHNNYVRAAGTPEVVTNAETTEETEFLNAVLATTVMKKAQRFLNDKGLLTSPRRTRQSSASSDAAFRDALRLIWFGLYSRQNRTLGSSGFEHVFLGEVKDGKVSGFHNWVFFSKEEANNAVNYRGRIGTVISLGGNKGKIIKHKFDWGGVEKPISSMFVGTSPEFELALYTVCFYARPGAGCPVKLGGRAVSVQTHYMNRQGKRYVASAFPDI